MDGTGNRVPSPGITMEDFVNKRLGIWTARDEGGDIDECESCSL